MIRLLCALALGLVMSGGLAAAPASAESGSVEFERGDAPSRIDLTAMEVKNADKRFTVTLEVRNLRERQRGFFFAHYWRHNGDTPPARSLFIQVRQRDGVAKARFFACGAEDCAAAKCSGPRVRWDHRADEIVMSAPQRCYPRPDGAPAPRSGRFFAYSALDRHTVDDPQGDLVLERG